MKKTLIALALCLPMVSTGAFAQAQSNTGILGAQINNQQGFGNAAFNNAAIVQAGQTGKSGPSSVSSYTPKSGYPSSTQERRVAGTLKSLFGDEPIVDNSTVVGTQVNVQNGSGNVADNTILTNQNGFGQGGGLSSNNVAVGTQLNIQNGNGNVAANTAQINQLGAVSGPSYLSGLVRNQVAVGTQVNVQNGDNNFASNLLGVNQTGLSN